VSKPILKEEVEGLVDKIKECTLCARFGELIKVDDKPYLKFRVYEEWIPEGLRCLFVAESPPPEGFFYDSRSKSQLRRNLLSLLGIEKGGCEGLEEFRRRGFLLVDAIECRVDKRGIKGRRSIPTEAIRNCSLILKDKVKLARSRGASRIVVLGSTALKALSLIGFEELRHRKVGEGCSLGNFFLCALPVKGTKRLWDRPEVRKGLRRFCLSGPGNLTRCA
jgi:uracil-DNA glycosylase